MRFSQSFGKWDSAAQYGILSHPGLGLRHFYHQYFCSDLNDKTRQDKRKTTTGPLIYVLRMIWSSWTSQSDFMEAGGLVAPMKGQYVEQLRSDEVRGERSRS